MAARRLPHPRPAPAGEGDDKTVWDQLRQCCDQIQITIVDLVPLQDENPAAIGGRLIPRRSDQMSIMSPTI